MSDNSSGRDAKGRFLPNNQISVGHASDGRETHGLSAAQQRLREFGSRAIDRRSKTGKALMAWKGDLIRDLGGEDQISTQQRQVIDMCCRTKLLLDSLDVWLLQQGTLVKKGSVLPVVIQRQKLADSLAKHLGMLGLERRAVKDVTNDLDMYLAAKRAKDPNEHEE